LDTVLVANVPHYNYLAASLHNAGRLQHYVAANIPLGHKALPRLLPSRLSRKLEGRRLASVPPDRVTTLRLPEILQRTIPLVPGISSDIGTLVNNHLFDAFASRFAAQGELLHAVSSVALYSARRAQRARIPVVIDVRQEHPFFQRRMLAEESEIIGLPIRTPGSLWEKKVLRELELANAIVVPSSYAKQTFAEEGFESAKIFVAPYGVDSDVFTAHLPRSSSFRVLFVGTLCPRKGVHYLLKAFSSLNLPDAELVLIGDIDDDVRPILSRYDGNFRYAGAVPKVDLATHYASSSVLVLPSLADAFPLAVLEAMACGLPAIVSENTGSAEMIRSDGGGFVVPVRDADAIAERLCQLYEDRDLLERTRRAATHTARRYSWDTYGERVLAIHDTITGVSTA
jgi:glycosyltransferase involved in cell wall biosynthesis